MPQVSMQVGPSKDVAKVTETILRAAALLHARVPVQRISFVQDGQDPLRFDYRIDLLDGRRWRQTLVFRSPTDLDPPMSFATGGDMWRRSEFTEHRPIRDGVVTLAARYGLTEIVIDDF